MKIDRIINFTDAYHHFSLFEQESEVVDFTHLRGTNGYCSDEAASEIRKAFQGFSLEKTNYIDDGNHHYLTFFSLELIKEPFDLVVFDHHTDLQPPSLLPILSCGGWIRSALFEMEFLQKVYLIGPPSDAFEKEEIDECKDRIVFVDEEEANTGSFVVPKERPIYISIDLDVLSENDFKSVWDQGSMRLPRLLSWQTALKESKKILGIDICG